MSSEKRIEVAERLREGGIARDAKEAYVVILCCIGIRPQLPADKTYQEALTLLADLIEPEPIGEDTSDGYHTFGQLYYQRMMLWACIVNANPGIAWKTRLHEDGGFCFGGGWFLVAIDTPAGQYGYHYEDTPKNWALFCCEEIPRAKPWDGYTEADVTRLASLAEATCCHPKSAYCPNCGARVVRDHE